MDALAPRPSHVPERSCVACRRKRPQPEFLRLVRTAGVWALQPGVRSGRGAYVCADSPSCWTEKRLRRAFGAQAPALSAVLTAALPGLPLPESTRRQANNASRHVQHPAME
ncbi:YlxR family protein [Deinococcus sp. KNUC1210]|uniref:YlxR family protein n=1 Tax=Deinococcus sp. KNUC1210 TaxID=2917691 RepID=UPI001EEFD1D6|nr:YlxR family protein [Deinococcus sp. KNUC1210]ULH15423.1 YlxR family protein [Deinococcus sp. KNUC1210]